MPPNISVATPALATAIASRRRQRPPGRGRRLAHPYRRPTDRRNIRGGPPRNTETNGYGAANIAGGRYDEVRRTVMKALLQRVGEADVTVADRTIARIGHGLLVLLCVEQGDGEAEADLLARKIAHLRIFDDAAGKMNRSVRDVGGSALVVSQFTLAADWRKGNRPSFSGAASPELAEALYARFSDRLRAEGVAVATGAFAARMAVRLVNDGPVTIWMDTRTG
jgi:D-tyrosyl-tRNA(Tyr) deacylase